MRILARLIVSREADPGLRARLRSIFPKQSAPESFWCSAPLDDPRTQEVLGLLENAGLTRWDDTKGKPRARDSEYTLSYERVYDAADLSACEYLQIVPPHEA